MNLDDEFGLIEALAQTGVLALDAGQFVGQRIARGRASAPARRQGLFHGPLALQAPVAQVRGVQALAPQQRADLAVFAACVGLLEDAALVSGREAPARGFFADFGIGRRPVAGGADTLWAGRGGRFAPGRLASLATPSLRVPLCPPPRAAGRLDLGLGPAGGGAGRRGRWRGGRRGGWRADRPAGKVHWGSIHDSLPSWEECNFLGKGVSRV